MHLAVFALVTADSPLGWQPWWALVVTVVVSAVGFAYLRLNERFTVDRLAREAPPSRTLEQDEAGHSPIRGALLACLYSVSALERTVLLEGLEASESELDEQIAALELDSHVLVERRGRKGRTRTWLSLTVPGRQACGPGVRSPGH